jgi:hypothetical protein
MPVTLGDRIPRIRDVAVAFPCAFAARNSLFNR